MIVSAEPKRRGRPPKVRAAPAIHGIETGEAATDGNAAPEAVELALEPHYVEDGASVDVPASEAKPDVRPANCLSQHERHGLIEEALYTHEMQLEHVRFDTRNRRWTFKPDSRNNVASLLIELKRGPDYREQLIDNARFGAENVREDVEAAIDLLDEALA